MSDPAAPDTASPGNEGPPRPFDRYVPQRRFQQAVAISPDGASVAYVANDGGQHNIWIRRSMAPAPGRSRRSRTTRCARWRGRRTASRLAFAADHHGDEQFQVYLVDTAGGEPRRLTHADDRQFDLQDAPFSRDGRLLVYAGNDRDEMVQDLLVHDLSTDTVRRVESVAGEFASSVAVSPDGRWLLAGRRSQQHRCQHRIVDLRDDESAIRVLTPHDGEVDLPAGGLVAGLVGDVPHHRRRQRVPVPRRLHARRPRRHARGSRLGRRGFRARRRDGSTVGVGGQRGGASVPYVARPPTSARRRCGVAGARSGRRARRVRRHPRRRARSSACGAPGTRPTDLVRIDVATGALDHLTDSRPPALARRRAGRPGRRRLRDPRRPPDPGVAVPADTATDPIRWCCRSTADPSRRNAPSTCTRASTSTSSPTASACSRPTSAARPATA